MAKSARLPIDREHGLDLTLLALDIQEAILQGRQARGVQLEELTRAMPRVWGEQWRHFCSRR
jgi:hypothetical protein